MPQPSSQVTTARRLTSAIGAWLGRVLWRSEGLLAATFALLVVIGTVLLWLPAAHENDDVGLLEALFTATSAVCVAGLTVVDTGTAYTPFGHAVILVLIQLGGLGIMTFAALAAQLIGGKLSFRSQAIISDTFYQTNAAANLRRDLKRIVGLTLGLECVGATHLRLVEQRPCAVSEYRLDRLDGAGRYALSSQRHLHEVNGGRSGSGFVAIPRIGHDLHVRASRQEQAEFAEIQSAVPVALLVRRVEAPQVVYGLCAVALDAACGFRHDLRFAFLSVGC